MTSSALPSLAEDLHNILNSFGSMLEGVYYIDEDLAGSLAEKFSDRLRESTRSIYACLLYTSPSPPDHRGSA